MSPLLAGHPKALCSFIVRVSCRDRIFSSNDCREHWGECAASGSLPAIADEVINKLRHVSTATLATALFKRGLRNQVIQGVQPLGPLKANMAGMAFTLRYIPAREDLNPLSVFLDPQHPQRKAVEECPPGRCW